jgi:hypothetical protein
VGLAHFVGILLTDIGDGRGRIVGIIWAKLCKNLCIDDGYRDLSDFIRNSFLLYIRIRRVAFVPKTAAFMANGLLIASG